MKKTLRICVALLLAVTNLFAQGLFDLDEDDGNLIDGLLDEIYDNESTGWWNREWKFRRRIAVSDPEMVARGVVLFQDPDPLLLYNTGRCRDKLTDLRVISRDGKLLPSGVINFGRDDGSCYIWCKPKTVPASGKIVVYAYYGNESAKPTDSRIPTIIQPGKKYIDVQKGPEEILDGARLPPRAQKGAFFGNIVTVEAEQFVGSKTPNGLQTRRVPSADASGGSFLAAARKWPQSKTCVAANSVTLPQTGRWYIHVRYKLSRPGKAKSITVAIGDKEFTHEPKLRSAASLQWRSFEADLNAGKQKIELRFVGHIAPDCMILTQDQRYRPDYRDITGPIWMRFKAIKARQAFYIHIFAWHTTFSAVGAKGDTTCWLFKDLIATDAVTYEQLAANRNRLLPSDTWSPWAQSVHSRQYTWFNDVRFLHYEGARPKRVRDLKIEFECATQPDRSRSFVSGIEEVDYKGMLRIRMPTELALSSLNGPMLTESFGQWAQRRFELAENVGLKGGRGPTNIVVGTMAHDIRTATELEYFLKTCNWLGFNFVNVGYHDEVLFKKLAVQYGMPWKINHHTAYGVTLTGLTNKANGKTYAQTIDQRLAENADRHYKNLAKRHYAGVRAVGRAPRKYGHLRYSIYNDETQVIINSIGINRSRLFRHFFAEYLQDHGLTPQFFGLNNWDALRAIDYTYLSAETMKEFNKQMQKIQALLAAQKEFDRSKHELKLDDDEMLDELLDELLDDNANADEERIAKLSPKDQQFLDWAEEVMRNRERNNNKAKGLTSVEEKKIYHWTQKFKNHYYCMFYRNVSEASKKHFPPDYNGGINMQPHPGLRGEMFGGYCSLFEVGRQRALNCLQWEDWDCGTVNVAFGSALTRAAARKCGQELAALVVGGRPKRRIMANLANEVRYMIFYLYGPVHRIGPVWAERPATLKDIGETLAQAGKCEPDILAARNRPCDAALLIANTCEINAAYGSYGFGRERLTIYETLLNAHIPIELIGEEEVIEDGILDRFKLLYVGDSHVDSRAQKKILNWVKKGGVLWASLPAFMKKEYDQKSTILNKAFGIRLRAELTPFPRRGPDGEPQPFKMAGSDMFDACIITSPFPPPLLRLKNARPCGAFEKDGSAALIHNRYGKGHTFLASFMMSYLSDKDGNKNTKELQGIKRNLLAAPATLAGARQHVRVEASQPWTWVHDGPDQTVVYAINNSMVETFSGNMKVSVPHPVIRSYSGLRNNVPYEQLTDNSVSVPYDLPPGECEIIVLKHK